MPRVKGGTVTRARRKKGHQISKRLLWSKTYYFQRS